MPRRDAPQVASCHPAPAGAPAAELRYQYDAGNDRTLKTAVDPVGNELHSVYVFPSLELRRATWTVEGDYERTSATEAAYLFANGVRLARLYYADDDIPTVSSGHLHVLFELADHLGSSSFVVDKATSELVEATRYQAYGATESDYRPARWGGYREDHRFTGKEEDIEVGLTYFGQRYLAPSLNRWISPDPLAVHVPGEADLNLYAYVHGRVLRAVDPNGLDDEDAGAPHDAGSAAADGGSTEVAGAPPTRDVPSSPDAPASRVHSIPEVRIVGNPVRGEKAPLIPFFISDGAGGRAWSEAVRAVQTPGPGAPNGLAAIRQLNGGAALAVAQFSREQAPGTSVQNLTSLAVSAAGEAGGVIGATAGGARAVGVTGRAVTVTQHVAPNPASSQAGRASTRLTELLQAADAADRGGLTAAGRALQKHGSRTGSAFPSVRGTPQQINAAGRQTVEGILTSPEATTVTRHHARYGEITEIRLPDGRGLRYDVNGRFRGLLEPP